MLNISGILILVLVLMIATVAVTIPVCHFRFARKKRISSGTMLVGACMTPLLAMFALFVTDLFSSGWAVFSMDYWTEDIGLMGWIVLWGVAVGVCLLPALGVVTYYRAKQAR